MRENEALIRDMLRAVEERDATRILEIYDPDVEFVWPPSLPAYGGTHKGADALPMHLAFAAVWDPLQPTDWWRRMNSRIVASNDDEVIVLYHQRGIDEQGSEFDTEVLALYRVAGGKVTRLQMFYFDAQGAVDFVRQSLARRAET